MGFSVMLWGAEKLVPVEYWCPYGTSLFDAEWRGQNNWQCISFEILNIKFYMKSNQIYFIYQQSKEIMK